VSIQTGCEEEQPFSLPTTVMGIDLGIACFATSLDGTFFAPLNSFRYHEQALTKAQRALSRKQKFSNNWKKSQPASLPQFPLCKTSTAISQNPRWGVSRIYRCVT
jgi:putative transposase